MKDALVLCQRELEPETQHDERCWSDLPHDLLSLILSKVFFLDRCKLRLVMIKYWMLTSPIPQPLSTSSSFDHESPYFNSPCFMYSDWGNNSWKLFRSLYNQLYDFNFEELIDADILFSKYGWLLISRVDHKHESITITLFFFNPFTKQKIQLPYTYTWPFISACFTSPPTSPDCTVVGILHSARGYIEFGLLKIGEQQEWRSKTFVRGSFTTLACPPLYCNGIYYCSGCDSRKIYVFDPKKENKWRWIQYVTKDEDEDYNYDYDYEGEEEEEEEDVHECYMAQVDGDIWGVFIMGDERRVSVNKLDPSEMRWVELETLGDKCLYVSSNGSFAETCLVDGMANIIYFNKFYGQSGIFYSLKTRMYHSVTGDFASKEDYGLTKVDFGAWIKPTL